jgi:hypothetical protein
MIIVWIAFTICGLALFLAVFVLYVEGQLP